MPSSFDSSSRLPADADDGIPSKLADGFAELYPAPPIPASMDSAILNTARVHFARRSAGRSGHYRLFRWAGAAAAAAAVAAVGFALMFALRLTVELIALRPHVPPAAPAAAIAGDINGDGRVDILDAYLVARALADKSRTGSLPAAWDVNHDGVVDIRDVDWIANAAVRVGGPVAVGNQSKLARSDEVFKLAQDLKALNTQNRPSNVALVFPPAEQSENSYSANAHGACTVSRATVTDPKSEFATHGASTVGVPVTKGAFAQ